jgi:hypothetical protein
MIVNTDISASSASLPSIAFLGNSILYYNDCPRLLQAMLQASRDDQVCVQNSCLRGGATLTSLWQEGNGMRGKFQPPSLQRLTLSTDKNVDIHPNSSTDSLTKGSDNDRDNHAHSDDPNTNVDQDSDTSNNSMQNDFTTSDEADILGAPTVSALALERAWDFWVLNDYTQHPARPTTRDETLHALATYYIPLWKQQQQSPVTASSASPTIVWLHTMAYEKEAMKDTHDLGSLDQFTDLLLEGYRAYKDLCCSYGLSCRIAPMGEAVRYVHHHYNNGNGSLWNRLYHSDHFHPSRYGTWLQACVLYCTLTDGATPPRYQDSFWRHCRYSPDLFPNESVVDATEAEILRQVAMQVCASFPK